MLRATKKSSASFGEGAEGICYLKEKIGFEEVQEDGRDVRERTLR